MIGDRDNGYPQLPNNNNLSVTPTRGVDYMPYTNPNQGPAVIGMTRSYVPHSWYFVRFVIAPAKLNQ